MPKFLKRHSSDRIDGHNSQQHSGMSDGQAETTANNAATGQSDVRPYTKADGRQKYYYCPFNNVVDSALREHRKERTTIRGATSALVRNSTDRKEIKKDPRAKDLNEAERLNVRLKGNPGTVNLATEIRPSQAPPATQGPPPGQGPLGRVNAGDWIYLNGHGAEKEGNNPAVDERKVIFGDVKTWSLLWGLLQGKKRVGMTAKQVARKLVADGLQDGTEDHPIFIKCLVCYAGGPELTFDQWKAKMAGASNGSADEHFAQSLAWELGQLGRQNILVGGYPGIMVPIPNNPLTRVNTGSANAPIDMYLPIHQNAVWYDTGGELVPQNPGEH